MGSFGWLLLKSPGAGGVHFPAQLKSARIPAPVLAEQWVCCVLKHRQWRGVGWCPSSGTAVPTLSSDVQKKHHSRWCVHRQSTHLTCRGCACSGWGEGAALTCAACRTSHRCSSWSRRLSLGSWPVTPRYSATLGTCTSAAGGEVALWILSCR